MLALPLGMQTFYHSYRVRLKEFRRNYRLLFVISFTLLIFNGLIVLFNQQLYLLIENPKRHFAYRAHIAKELAEVLKEENIRCVDVRDDHQMQLRLRFYGVGHCRENLLHNDSNKLGMRVTVSYMNRSLIDYYVSKMHN